jgi:hypothetical protein
LFIEVENKQAFTDGQWFSNNIYFYLFDKFFQCSFAEMGIANFVKHGNSLSLNPLNATSLNANVPVH